MTYGPGNLRPLHGVAAPAADRRRSQTVDAAAGQAKFKDLLREKAAPGLQWSRHAESRLRAAGITLSDEELGTIEQAVSAMAQRGTRDGLVVYDNLALVVSVRNRTVVTAATPERLEDGVFTQIDGAALITKSNQGAGPSDTASGVAAGAPDPWSDGSGSDLGRLMQR